MQASEGGTVPTPDAIPARWLTKVLRAGGSLAEGRVVYAEATDIGRDRGLTGTSVRVVPRYDPPGAGPPALVAKFPYQGRIAPWVRRRWETDEGRRALFETALREIRFYRDLARPGLPVPRLLGSDVDEASWRCALLLEHCDGRPGDAVSGCGVADARAVVSAAAQLHGAFAAPASRGAVPAWLRRWRGRATTRDEVERYVALPGVPAACKATARRLPDVLPAALDELEGGPFTLFHGDLHLDNVLWTAEGACILDWQSVRLGPAALDFAALVFDALSPGDRRSVEDELLRTGHEGIAAAADPRTGAAYDGDAWREDVRRALAVHFGAVVRWLAATDLAAHAGRERALLEALRGNPGLAAALEDHGVADLPDGAGRGRH